MDLQDCGADTPEPPPGKMNRTAFKLFVKRRSGSGMPSIFGVRSKGEAAKGKGLPRSQTHEGLAAEAAGQVVLESSRKPETPMAEPPTEASGEAKAAQSSGPAKPHSFFSLLRKGGGGRGESATQQQDKAAGIAGKQRRGGLRGLLSGMQRWRRGSEPPPEEPAPLSASLTASMERVPAEPPGEAPAPEEEQREAEEDDSPLSSLHIEDIIQEAEGRAEEEDDDFCGGPEDEEAPQPEEEVEGIPAPEEEGPPPAPAYTLIPLAELSAERVGLLFADAASLKSFDSLTGCGDITAEPEEERAVGPAGEEEPMEEPTPQQQQQPPPAVPEPGPAEGPQPLLIYQGGGEEMASPEGVDDPDLQDFWEALPRPEDPEPPVDGAHSAEDMGSRVAPLSPVEDHSSPVEEDHSSPVEEDHSTSEQDSAGRLQEETLSRGSCQGEALYELSPEPKEHLPQPQEDPAPVPSSKPLSPVTAQCPLKAATGGGTKDSKIPISRKHLPVHPPPNQGTDPTPSLAQQPPSKSEIPRTKIPVSKVLVRRVSNRVLPGTTYKTSTLQDTAKK